MGSKPRVPCPSRRLPVTQVGWGLSTCPMLNPYSSTLPGSKICQVGLRMWSPVWKPIRPFARPIGANEISSVDWIMDFDSNDFQSFVSSRRSTRDFLPPPFRMKSLSKLLRMAHFSELEQPPGPFGGRGQRDVRDKISKDFFSRVGSDKRSPQWTFGKSKRF
ncbi:MAG: hypothetical protein Ct9H90mP16_03240 [Candidatus Poseidoniales archaeon]|nr:MAG: hypothetical protein Ct9H90mP16_03240 [Candidatus Poseidoniales archaeon]